MNPPATLHNEALAYHQRLPQRLWKYLSARCIPDALIHKHLLGWNGQRITIPIPDRSSLQKFWSFQQALEQFSRVNIELPVDERRAQTCDRENQTFYSQIPLFEPGNRSTTEQNEQPRRFKPCIGRFVVFEPLGELSFLGLERLPILDELIV